MSTASVARDKHEARDEDCVRLRHLSSSSLIFFRDIAPSLYVMCVLSRGRVQPLFPRVHIGRLDRTSARPLERSEINNTDLRRSGSPHIYPFPSNPAGGGPRKAKTDGIRYVSA